MATHWDELVQTYEVGILGAVVLDDQFVVHGLSDALLGNAGHDRRDVVGRSGLELVHPDDLDRAAKGLAETLVTPGPRERGMYRMRHKDGTFHRYGMSAINLGPDHGGTIVFLLSEVDPELRASAFAEDVVDVVRMLGEEFAIGDCLEWVIRVGERHVDGMQLVITTLDDERSTCYARGSIPQAIQVANDAARPHLLPPHVSAAAEHHRRGPWQATNQVSIPDDDHPGRLTSIVSDHDGVITGYVEALRETTEEPDSAEWLVHALISRVITAVLERHALDQRLRHAADHDDLTGLVNRRRLLEDLERHDDLAGSQLFLIDLDRFSWINNTLGHLVGDDALRQSARQLVAACPVDALVARLGGDEFVVWIPRASAVDFNEAGEAIRTALAVPIATGDRRSLLRGSVGMVEIETGESVNDAIQRADAAMYIAKHQGGDSATRG